MLLRSFNRAVFTPKQFVDDILSGQLEPAEELASTETLGFVDDVSLSSPAFERQLQSASSFIVEAAILALRVLVGRKPTLKFDAKIRGCLVALATGNVSPTIRIGAAECLADFTFM